MLIPVALSQELTNQPLRVDAAREQFVLFRDADGTVRALHDLCPHRHVSLSLGRVHEGRLQCAYHGLIFNGDGVCVHVPSSLGKVPGSNAKVFLAAEKGGLIFLDPNPGTQNTNVSIEEKDGLWIKVPQATHERLKNSWIEGVGHEVWGEDAPGVPFLFIRLTGAGFKLWRQTRKLKRLART